jgi:hypothetical protein
MRAIQRDLQSQVRAQERAARDLIQGLVRPLAQSELDAHPEPNGWSIAQVLEHLCLAGELSQAPAIVLLRSAPKDPAAPGREWKSSFLGELIASSLSKPKKLKGPKVFQPGPAPRAGIVDAFLTGEERFLHDLDDAGEVDWRALRLPSAAFPSWAPKVNLGDGFRIHSVHVDRHSHQIERLVRAL